MSISRPLKRCESNVSSLLAQHELNLEIFSAFVDTLRWLIIAGAVPTLRGREREISGDLSSLFGRANKAESLDALIESVVAFEQDEINRYLRDQAFGEGSQYSGSAQDTVVFVRRLCQHFRKYLGEPLNMRLFLLIDEFESLSEIQQTAVNTVMKMRLPDLSLKVGVRRLGRKTNATFTAGDPIQDPRDYTPVSLDYDITDSRYAALLEGIARRRLAAAGYDGTSIREYLPSQVTSGEISVADLDAEIQAIWESGQRRNEAPNEEFREKYVTTAVHRVLQRTGRRKTYAGFDQYVLLSSGTISTFIELCKYAFYFALNGALSLREHPSIPAHLQSQTVYFVSERLLQTIASNVERVGAELTQLLSDIGLLLRSRLLRHPSETEANRLSIGDYNRIAAQEYSELRTIIEQAVIWSVFHIEGAGRAFLPKNPSTPSTADIIINRIYCPALKISPRARWRVGLNTEDLSKLASSEGREQAF